MRLRTRRRVAGVIGALCLGGSALFAVVAPPAAQAASPSGVTWMKSYAVPGTPARFDRVGVIKVGPVGAKNVLVLEPGTSAGSAYFVPLAKWIVAKVPGWQVWAVERRENLLEDQSMLNRFKEHRATARQLFDYYLGYLTNKHITHHFQPIGTQSVEFAKSWGLKVAVEDLHTVISAAKARGGKVVLGGHSLGGAVVTAYATWDFHGRPGADQLAGLLYIDGASLGQAETAKAARQALKALDQPSQSPWLSFGGIPAPYAGIFSATGSAAALFDPDGPSLGQKSGLLPSSIVPKVPVTNVAQFGYALNVATSPPSLIAAQAHLGQGISKQTVNGYHLWNGKGALTPISRFATMLSGGSLQNVDGSEWYFPQRLTDDTASIDNGNANPAQKVLGVRDTMGHDLPHSLLLYAFGARLGGKAVLQATEQLAEQSKIPSSHLTLVNRHATYAHNDPNGAYPHNAFFAHLVPWLHKVEAS